MWRQLKLPHEQYDLDGSATAAQTEQAEGANAVAGSCMENNHWFRNELLLKYEAGVWVLLIVVAAGILGLIFWLGYELLL